MKIELYNLQKDIHSQAIKKFLNLNNLPFKEIQVNIEQAKNEFNEIFRGFNNSVIKVTHSHSIHQCQGFNEPFLNQLIEHIKKYEPKIIK